MFEVTKKEFHESFNKGTQLKDVDVNKIVVSNKIKGNNDSSKVFIGYIDDFVSPLCYCYHK